MLKGEQKRRFFIPFWLGHRNLAEVSSVTPCNNTDCQRAGNGNCFCDIKLGAEVRWSKDASGCSWSSINPVRAQITLPANFRDVCNIVSRNYWQKLYWLFYSPRWDLYYGSYVATINQTEVCPWCTITTTFTAKWVAKGLGLLDKRFCEDRRQNLVVSVIQKS